MHIHGNPMNYTLPGVTSAAAAENAATRERAAEVRRRLLKSAAAVEAPASPEEAFLIGRWTGSSAIPEASPEPARTPGSGRVSEFG
jgi:hypothetical protein